MLVLVLSLAALFVSAAGAPGATAAENPAGQPPFGAEPPAELREPGVPPGQAPPGFRLTPREAISIADATPTVEAELGESPTAEPEALLRGPDRWQIGYFDSGGTQVAQVVIEDPTGEVAEAWRDHQVEVKLARGYEDAVAGNVSEAWIWIPLCLLFFLPFFDPKRPFRLLHLDLLVLLGFSLSSFFFNKGEIVTSVPLVYPVLGYLFARLLIAGLRPRKLREGALVPVVPINWMLWAGAGLFVFRIGLNLIDSQVIDIGVAGVIGADQIAGGDGVYEGSLAPEIVDRGDSYGPLNYLLYVPFEALFPWDGGFQAMPAAHALAIVFDTLIVGLLFQTGRMLRVGEDGRALGIALAFAWLAYPYTLYALNVNGNDAIVGAAMLGALLALGSPALRGAIVGAGGAAKFGPLGLAPMFAAGRGENRIRSTLIFGAAFIAVWAVVLIPLLPDGGLSEFYDRTFGYQASRGSPFSVWGLEPSLEWLQNLTRALPVVLGLALYLIPGRRTATQIAALGAALLIATQVGSTHWFYFFILWWAPYALVAFFATQREITPRSEAGTLEARPA